MTIVAHWFRRLPSVDELLKGTPLPELAASHGRAAVTEAARSELERLRAEIAGGTLSEDGLEVALAGLTAAVAVRVARRVGGSLRPVINASGVINHTNLGRVPLSADALDRVVACARGYSNLEFDLETGERGRRDDHARALLDQLAEREGISGVTGIVVNNNAAAVFLALAALAKGGEVIVSRGELVEIGGSFRIPDIMAQSGATLREVGTTNRTRIEDYERAIGADTRLLLRVHRSNFEIVGFTEQPELSQLVELGRRRGIPVMEDLGSGALLDMERFGIAGEPSLFQSLREGVSLVTASGDKLLGGPQAGLVVGAPDLVAELRRHPLFRALRVDKMCYAALEGTLISYLREKSDQIPLLAMLGRPAEEVERRCRALVDAVPHLPGRVVGTRAVIGGGAAPGKSVASFALALVPTGMSAQALASQLRRQSVPVVARIEDGCVLLDLRTVDPADDAYLTRVLAGLAP